MERKKKIFYLDFIRGLSMIMIVTYHFYVHFQDNNISGFTLFYSNNLGMIGVTLFFMLSGASLMYNYGDKLDIKKYAKKRFLGIYPMFWIAYSMVFIYIFYGCKKIIWELPLYKLGFSFLGMDGYLSVYTETFYIIGEWFLGCIILIYITFPILRKLINKYPKIFFIINSIINFGILLFYKNGIMPLNKNFFVCIYSFILGMYIIKYLKNINIWQMLISLFFVIIAFIIPTKSQNIEVLIANFIGYNVFVILAYIGDKINNLTIQKIFEIIGKYSYAVFLVHHYIIMKIESTFQNANLRISETLLLYITCWVVIAIFAKLLYILNNKIVKIFINKEEIKKIEEHKYIDGEKKIYGKD